MPRSFFPNATSRAIDYPAWRLINATAEFDDPGRHWIVVTDQREDNDAGEIVAAAEWIAPGGPDLTMPPEEQKAKWKEVQKQWPASLNREALAAFGAAVGPALTSALARAGLPKDADKQMWGMCMIEACLRAHCYLTS